MNSAKPRLLLHAGMHKTGTTALQAFACSHRKALAARGWLYPDFRPLLQAETEAHHDFAHALAGQSKRLDFAGVSALVQAWEREAREAGLSVLLSSEALCRHLDPEEAAPWEQRRRKYLASVAQVLSQFDVTVGICIRRQDEYIRSMYQEHIFKLNPSGLLPFKELREVSCAGRLRYWDNIKLFEEAFGKVEVLVYEDFRSAPGYCAAFFEKLGVNVEGLAETGVVRRSLGIAETRAMQFLQSITGGLQQEPPTSLIHRVLSDWLCEPESAGILKNGYARGDFDLWESTQTHRSFFDSFEAENRVICERYFPGRQELFPPWAQKRELQEAPELSSETKALLLAALRTKLGNERDRWRAVPPLLATVDAGVEVCKSKQDLIPIVLFAGSDEGAALHALHRLRHHTDARHPVWIYPGMPAGWMRLQAWVATRAGQIRVLSGMSDLALREQLKRTSVAVFMDSSTLVSKGWLKQLLGSIKSASEPTLAFGIRDSNVGWCASSHDPADARSSVHQGCIALNAAAIARLPNTLPESLPEVSRVLSGFWPWARVEKRLVKSLHFPVTTPGVPRTPVQSMLGSIRRESDSPLVLTVIHDAEGGAVRTTEDLAVAMAVRSWRVLLLRCGPSTWRLQEVGDDGLFCTVATVDFVDLWAFEMGMTSDREAALHELLQGLRPDVAHVRHLLGSGPKLIGLLRHYEVPTVLSHHDFFTICPNIQLVDETGACCFGDCKRHDPIRNTAADCQTSGIWDLPALDGNLRADLKPAWAAEMHRELTASVSVHITTSNSTRDILCAGENALSPGQFVIIPHGRTFSAIAPVAVLPALGSRIGVLSLGHLDRSKGVEILLQLAKNNVAAGFSLELVHCGTTTRTTELRAAGVEVTGAYERDALGSILGGRSFAFGLVAPIWPETFSHTLTELWALGLPIVASDLGAVAERIRARGGGWLLDPTKPEIWFPTILKQANDLAGWECGAREAASGAASDLETMIDAYEEVYRGLLKSAPSRLRRLRRPSQLQTGAASGPAIPC